MSPVAADIIISLLVLDQVCLVSATNGCFLFKRDRRVQAGEPGAGRNKAVAPNII